MAIDNRVRIFTEGRICFSGDRCSFEFVKEENLVYIQEHVGDCYTSTIEDFIAFAEILKGEI